MKLERKFFWRLGGGILLLYLVMRYWNSVADFFFGALSAAVPLLLGLAIAYILNILMSAYERFYFPNSTRAVVQKSRRGVCLILAFASLVLILVWLTVLVLPQLLSCIQVLGNEIPKQWNNGLGWLEQGLEEQRFAGMAAFVDGLALDWDSIKKTAMDWFFSGIGGAMDALAKVITKTFSWLVTLLVAVIFAVYLLYSKEKLSGQLDRVAKHYLKPRWMRKLYYIKDTVHESFRGFIVGQTIEAVILGVLCAVGMTIFRLPYPTMVGAVVGFTALIPVAGAYFGAGIGMFMIFTVSPMKALLFLVFILILQQLENNIIYPKVVGKSIGLPGVWVLAAITIGGGLLGVGGMLLGVPLAASLYHLLRDDMNEGTMRERDDSLAGREL